MLMSNTQLLLICFINMFINKIILIKSGNFITENQHIRLPVQDKWLHQFTIFRQPQNDLSGTHQPQSRNMLEIHMSFQPFNSPNVVFSETVQLLEIKHTDQCQSAQHQAGSNLRYTSQHRSEPVFATGF